MRQLSLAESIFRDSRKKIRYNVSVIYGRSQAAVDSNDVLFDLYKRTFDDNASTDSIEREGRILRNELRLFMRSEDKRRIDQLKQQQYRSYYGKK